MAASPPATREERIKAGYVLQFAGYVEWPSRAFSNDSAPLVFCVVGPAQFAAVLESTVAGRRKKNRPLLVRRLDRVEKARGCHLLYLSREEEQQAAQLKMLAGEPVLSIGESDSFLAQGGVINLVYADGSIRFDVNPKVAENSGIRISSHVLNLARQVAGTP